MDGCPRPRDPIAKARSLTAAAARILLVVVGFVASASPHLAHPGAGIVMDGRGNVYYTDLQQEYGRFNRARARRIRPSGESTIFD